MELQEKAMFTKIWRIRRYRDQEAYERDDCYSESVFTGNVLLEEGIGEMWDLICGLGSPTAFSNANARLGVGDDNTAASSSQTGLLGTNTLYKGMETGYPQRSGTSVTWRAVFSGSEANFDWNEFTVDNGSGAEINMNRKVDNQGTKTSGQVWTLDLTITLS